MKTPYEQRRELSIHTRHFGEASPQACLMYGILLTLFALIMILSSTVSGALNYRGAAEPDQVVWEAPAPVANRHTPN